MTPPLYRQAAVQAQRDAMGGATLQVQAPATGWITAAALLVAVLVLALAFGGHYTRKEHVDGYLAPTLGLIRVQTPQAGVVSSLRVSEGQVVRRGQVLLEISSEQSTASLRESHAAALAELRQRRESLRRERSKQDEIDALTGQAWAERQRALENEIAQAEAQRALQQRRVASAERTVRRHEELVARQFVAEITLQQKQDEWIETRNQLAQVERALTGLRRDLAGARIEGASAGLKGDNNAAALERQISELSQQLAETDARRAVTLTAPADGTVTNVLASLGQSAQPGTPLLSLLPAGGTLEAQLLVPSRAAGFIRPGQDVALRYQAFPFQRFGHQSGTVTAVGKTVIQVGDAAQLPVPVREPVYRISVSLPAQQLKGYGEALPLQAGMRLDADVSVDRRRLIEWVFDPLVALKGRL